MSFCRASLFGLAAIMLALTSIGTNARAERLIASVSNHRVTITPNYAGEQLVLFGSIEKDATTPATRAPYNVIVTVAGPRATIVTRRKERVLGIWINTDSRQFENVPRYLAVFSTRPFAAVASEDALRRLQIGLDNVILTQRVGPDFADVVPTDPFRSAFVRIKADHQLYREQPNGVTLLTPTLFRTNIALAAEAPIGTYKVSLVVVSGGQVVARGETAFEVVKIGFEQFVAENAQSHGYLYGLFTVAMALLTGWLASVIFRRD